MELQGSVSPFVQRTDSDLGQTCISGSCGIFSELCLAQRFSASFTLLGVTNCCGGRLQEVASSQLSSFQPWQLMLCISESLRFGWFFHDIVEIGSLHFYDLDIHNEFF